MMGSNEMVIDGGYRIDRVLRGRSIVNALFVCLDAVRVLVLVMSC